MSLPIPDPAARIAELEAQVRDLSATAAFATSLLDLRTDVDDILWDVANGVVARLGLEDCVIYLVDATGDHLVQRAAHGPKNPRGREILAPITIPVGRGIVGTVAHTGRAERIPDTRLDPRYITDDADRLSELAVPIRAPGEDRVVGVIDSEHYAEGFFTEHHEALLTTVASMTASRLALADLHQRLSDWNAHLERQVAERTAALRVAHERVERLLLGMLPPIVAARMAAGEVRIADRVDDVAVLFADLVGFTARAAVRSPEAVVDELERVFAAFDRECETLGCEKVKTVGDGWMAACGAPTPRVDALERLVELGCRLPGALASIDPTLRVRVGVHQGPVVAGVVGRNRVAWDLWGDTVNLASRLQSHGAPDAVHLVSEVAARLPPHFHLAPRGTIELRGRGPIATTFVTGAKAGT